MTAEEIQAFGRRFPANARPRNSDALAAALVEAGRLTPFQAKELLTGRQTPFVLGDYVLLDKLGAGGIWAMCSKPGIATWIASSRSR